MIIHLRKIDPADARTILEKKCPFFRSNSNFSPLHSCVKTRTGHRNCVKPYCYYDEPYNPNYSPHCSLNLVLSRAGSGYSVTPPVEISAGVTNVTVLGNPAQPDAGCPHKESVGNGASWLAKKRLIRKCFSSLQ